MLTYDTYKLIHLFGILLLFLALGGVYVHAIAGGEKRHAGRGLAMAAHGLGAVLILIGGFGMLARLEERGLPAWVHPKLAIWLVLAGAVALPFRYRALARPMLVLLPVIGAVAAWIGIYHP